jgi:hypothetical protein
VIDIVGFNDGAGKFLKQVCFFVGAAGRIQDGNGIRPVFFTDFLQANGDKIKGLFPGRSGELITSWRFQPRRQILPSLAG